MVADAEAAGFNPLTALRNGGAAGYSVTTTPALSSGEMVGQALGKFGEFMQNFDPFEDKLREVQYRTMEAQLDNLQADTRVKNRMFDVPAVSGSRRELRPSGSAGVLGQSRSATGLPQPATDGQVTVTNPWNAGKVDPNTLDADAFEQRYGDSELAQTLYGINTAAHDAYAFLKSQTVFGPFGSDAWVRYRPLTPDEKKARKGSWFPSFGIQWKSP